MNEVIKHKIKHNISRFVTSTKWVIFSIIVGIIVGICATAFSLVCLLSQTSALNIHGFLFFLPLGGMAIVGLYHLLKDDNDSGTNLVISAIHSGDHLPFKMAPLIFVSTLITHLFGGSAGREGAALQMGGSIGNSIGKFFQI